jgi:GNAT superfamily N-acetyltransferase
MAISYRHDVKLTPDQFIDVLNRSTLGQRRPVSDFSAINDMLAHADILITAWDGDVLVGVSRSMSDFAYVTYLSDLAVDERYQRQGIGKQLMRETQKQAKPSCKIVLFAAPAAEGYYGHIGLQQRTQGWVLPGRAP